jgi:hypothetical protein
VPWSEGPFEDNLREEAIEGDVGNGEAFPSGMIVEMPPGNAVLPEATLAGDGSPLADELGPTELMESNLRSLGSVLADEGSWDSNWLPLSRLPLLAVLSIFSSFGRFPSSHISFDQRLEGKLVYLRWKSSWL